MYVYVRAYNKKGVTLYVFYMLQDEIRTPEKNKTEQTTE